MERTEIIALYEDIEQVLNQDWPTDHKIDLLYQLLAHIFLDITRQERLYFSTLFSRIAFVADRHNIKGRELYIIHKFRRDVQSYKRKESSPNNTLLALGLLSLTVAIEHLYNVKPPTSLTSHIPDISDYKIDDDHQVKKYYPFLRSIIISIETDYMICILESNPHESVKVLTNLSGRNEIFNKNLEDLNAMNGLPINANLIQVEVDDHNHYRPGSILLEPDFLIDVTSVASTFKHYGTEAITYVFKRYMPKGSSTALLMGNVANFFLDELVTNRSIPFKDIFAKVFDLYPLHFAEFNDIDLRKFMHRCKEHFLNLKNVLNLILPSVDIQVDRVILEPSFFSEEYGLQGRLDLFEMKVDQKKVNIVELKSGKTFMPNVYKINQSHYIQTILYDLIIQSVFPRVSTANYILYSHYPDDSLRHAPVIRAQQKEALYIRNELLLYEKKLIRSEPRELHNLLLSLDSNLLPNMSGFDKADMDRFQKTYHQLSGVEKALFLFYTRFIATEHHLAKIGIEGYESNNGMASLWLNPLMDKEAKFDIFSNLRIRHIEASEDDTPLILLGKTELTNPLANFRVGDIVILYPHTGDQHAVLHHQIFKCIIVKIEEEIVYVRLRNKQISTELFNGYGLFNLEKDILDSSFRSLYRGLFAYTESPARKRQLLMGLIPPETPIEDKLELAKGNLTDQQHMVMSKALKAQDYFLLWGPPGSGKTSIMLKGMVRYLMENTRQNILLLAYTNKAVDEICRAIESIRPSIEAQYFRIGSRFSTAPVYKKKLLQTSMQSINNRKSLIAFIRSKRIVVGTIASIEGKRELFNLMNFEIAIVDEASQILDPQLMGLIVQVEKFILIGDHRQLPAVVVQTEDQSSIRNSSLNELGYINMRDSLFERLYNQCNRNKWSWAYDILKYQGRMHRDLMHFPSLHFYKDQLAVLPGKLELIEPPKFELVQANNPIISTIAKERLIFIPTPIDNFQHAKTNRYEAEWVVKLIYQIDLLYSENHLPVDFETVGVITPYRAQIALIKNMLSDHGYDSDRFTIDTVERYQGGARDIIIFSVCTNYLRQFHSLVSLSNEGVDRKLNVALTRARKQIILIGNKKLLSQNTMYKHWIDKAFILNNPSEEE